eukprot:Tbor_TRINITY_DN5405_c1_g2::TRINITY_DN5405_c1_g2_i1::g.24110::m.24110/K02183/CALM; calmodulin
MPLHDDDTIKEAFMLLSSDGVTITKDCLCIALNGAGLNLPQAHLDNVILPAVADGGIEFEVFKCLAEKYASVEGEDSLTRVKASLTVYDNDNNGTIKVGDMKHILHGIGRAPFDNSAAMDHLLKDCVEAGSISIEKLLEKIMVPFMTLGDPSAVLAAEFEKPFHD